MDEQRKRGKDKKNGENMIQNVKFEKYKKVTKSKNKRGIGKAKENMWLTVKTAKKTELSFIFVSALNWWKPKLNFSNNHNSTFFNELFFKRMKIPTRTVGELLNRPSE
jgi:hypothetical protein